MNLIGLIVCLGLSATLVRGLKHRNSLRSRLRSRNSEQWWWSEKVECTKGMDEECPQDNLHENDVKCVDYKPSSTTIVLGDSDEIPENLQGVYWLEDQKKSSSLVSFAETKDGKNIGKFEWNEEEKVVTIDVRVAGDRTWSFADKSYFSNYNLVSKLDLVYEFKCFCTGSDYCKDQEKKIDFCQIFPRADNMWGFVMDYEHLLDFKMEYDGDNDGEFHSWTRKSYYGSSKTEVLDKRYTVAQVFDVNGATTPKHAEWLDYCKNHNTDQRIYYRVAE